MLRFAPNPANTYYNKDCFYTIVQLQWAHVIPFPIPFTNTSSCARSAHFATCARSLLRSPCLHALKVQLIVILCCGVVYDCSHTADMHEVMKGVTCYKDASEHDWVLQWEQWCPCPRWRAARCDQLDDSIQVWRPVVESAWCELSSSPQEGWGPLYQAKSAQAHLLTRVSASLLVALSTWSSRTQASISFSDD